MLYEIILCILIPIALSMKYAFKMHNESLMQQQTEENRRIYQYVKENWMYLNGGDGE